MPSVDTYPPITRTPIRTGQPILDRILRALQPPQLSHIKHLGLFHCGIVHLPSAITTLVKLESLDLRHNLFTHIPDIVGQLTNLTTLELGENRLLTDLPACIGHLTRLDELQLPACSSLASLPDSLSALVSVTSFTLSGNTVLQSLPESFGHMRRLNHLYLDCNVAALPDSVTLLTNLKKLYIAAPVTTLPAGIGCLGRLSSLKIESPAIKELPETLSALHRLTALRVVNTSGSPALFRRYSALIILRMRSSPSGMVMLLEICACVCHGSRTGFLYIDVRLNTNSSSVTMLQHDPADPCFAARRCGSYF